MNIFDELTNIYNWITGIPNAIITFGNNTLMCTGMVIVESVLCIVIGWVSLNTIKIFFISGNDDTGFSNLINKIFMGYGLIYVIRWLDAYLYLKCR